jgi:hypothetical protein
MYKEAHAVPPPSPIGGIIPECGRCTHDYPSAVPFSPLPLFMGWLKVLFFEDFFLVIDDVAFKSRCFQKSMLSKVNTIKSQRFQKSMLSKVNAFKSQCFQKSMLSKVNAFKSQHFRRSMFSKVSTFKSQHFHSERFQKLTLSKINNSSFREVNA